MTDAHPIMRLHADGEHLVDVVPAVKDGQPGARTCACGREVMLAWIALDGAPLGQHYVLLHQAPPCDAFSRLDLSQAFEYLHTGRVPKERAPIVQGGPPP